MSSDSLEGKAKNGAGRVQRIAGAVADDPAMELGGEIRELQGRVQEAVGSAKDQIAKSADKARAVIGEASEAAADAYDELRDRAQKVADTVDPFVQERPYAALVIAGIAGLILGALFFGGGPKVIYVKPVVRA
jgi:uncharacterized protein YjbJ (UPF0337 family)